EIGEHALQCRRVRLQRIGAEQGAAGALGRGQELERRQHVAAARSALCARRGLDLAGARRLVVVFLLLLVLLFRFELRLQRGAGVVAEARLGAAARRRVAPPRRPRAPAEQAPQPCLEAEEFVRDPAERDRGPLLLLVLGFLDRLVFLSVLVGAQSEAENDR